MAQLPALYEQESEIAERRDRLCDRLARTERGCGIRRCTRRSQDPSAPTIRFISRIRVLTIESANSIRLAGLQIMAARYTAAALPTLQVRKRIRAGDRQRFFQAALELEDPIQGMAHTARRNRFHVSGYYTSGERDRETERPAALCDRFRQGRGRSTPGAG